MGVTPDRIDAHIKELLFDHDCVIVMELGGFIAHYHPAVINESLRFITPPSKKIAFNAALRANDGLLAHHISFRESLSYNEACRLIRDYAENINAAMSKGGKHKMEKVGVLFHDASGNIQFLPDSSMNFLPDSFGLPVVQAIPVRMEEQLQEAVDTTPDVVELPVREEAPKQGRIRKLKIMEVIPAAAILALLIMAPPVITRLNEHLGSLVPFSRVDDSMSDDQTNHRTHPVIDLAPPVYTADSSIDFTTDEAMEAPAIVPDEVSDSTSQMSSPSSGSAVDVIPDSEISVQNSSLVSSESVQKNIFHIIVGSFMKSNNARRMVRSLKDRNFDAEIIVREGNPMHLVSVFEAGTEAEAVNKLPSIQQEVGPSAWVLEEPVRK